jgi:hypothetical protein
MPVIANQVVQTALNLVLDHLEATRGLLRFRALRPVRAPRRAPDALADIHRLSTGGYNRVL